MKVQNLPGWPPKQFQCTDDPSLPYETVNNRGLVLESVTFVPGDARSNRPGDIVLTLVDSDRSEICTARLKIMDTELAQRVQAALTRCAGLTLNEAGLRMIA